MARPIITVNGISKAYRIGLKQDNFPTFREALIDMIKAPIRRFRQLGEKTEGDDILWALRDVSFEVQQGTVLGIIGRNGAGKSTLLKVLSRITEPTEGWARLGGRVASLLEVGTGFHPELTGRENVYLNGSILGLKKADIDRRFDQIVAFAEVEKFLETPVKRYSSGMYVRLAFAVAAHLDPEILIVDEVLAVGDAAFQRKSLQKMHDVTTKSGRTVLFVSHNMDAVLSLCSHVILVDQGRNSEVLTAEEGVRRYLATGESESPEIFLRDVPRYQHAPREPILTKMLMASSGALTNTIGTGEELTLILELENLQNVMNPDCGIIVHNERRQRVAVLHTRFQTSMDLPRRQHLRLACRIPNLPLVPGTYGIDIAISDGQQLIERVEQAGQLHVTFVDVFGTGRLPNSSQGCIVLPCAWSLAHDSAVDSVYAVATSRAS